MSGFTYRFSEKLSELIRKTFFVVNFPQSVKRISSVINKPTYYPEMERKSKKEMWQDNFKWLCKHHEVNTLYTSYGMDIKDFRDADTYISHLDFCLRRNAGNQALVFSRTGNYNYIVLLRDKYTFASYLASTIGKQYVVDSLALIDRDRVFYPASGEWQDVATLLQDGSELVYKVVDGECADGVMLVTVHGDQVTADGNTYTHQGFMESIKGKRILVQNVVKQHSHIQAFGTKSVNTIRIVTIMGKSGEVGVFAAFLRLSASADSFVDNRAVGGLGIGVNLEDGTLKKYGLPHDAFGVKMEVHPLSNIRFEGYQLPYWQETVALVKKAHKQFYQIQSIGWDVVLTEDGPVLLEGNDDWEISGPQDTAGGLKQRWEELANA